MTTLTTPTETESDRVEGGGGFRLSALDLIPVRAGQTTADALKATVSLAKVAERAGVHRYWVAEHHNMLAVASTNPPVLIALIAAATQTMRVGSGGVMLPNHAPLVVAEQFALLEAAYPGRIDLGVGRAPGSDPVTNWALRHGGPETADANQFDAYVDNLIAMMAPEGVGLQLPDGAYPLRATPHAVAAPPVWLLGSSDYSARLAAAKGMPYVFAHHFSGEGTGSILDLYRTGFKPSDLASQPTTFLTVNVAVAPTQAEAERYARPQLLAMVALRSGGDMKAQLSVEAAADVEMPPQAQAMADQMRSRWVIGTPDGAAAQIRDLATTYGVDEVMINPISGSSEADAPDTAPAREQTVELLASALAVR